jgi:hypothetical protein
MLLADQIGDRRDRGHAFTQRTWHRPIVVRGDDIRLRHVVQNGAPPGRPDERGGVVVRCAGKALKLLGLRPASLAFCS